MDRTVRAGRKNELLNRQIIIDMIQSKKETHLQQQLRVEKMAFGVLGIFLGIVCYTFWRNVAPGWISWYLLGMVIWLLLMQTLYVSDYIYLKDSN